MTIEVNPLRWFSDRRLDFVPKHFIRAPTPLCTQAQHDWIESKLQGRYSTTLPTDSGELISGNSVIFFEDPGEAMMYELRWSGDK